MLRAVEPVQRGPKIRIKMDFFSSQLSLAGESSDRQEVVRERSEQPAEAKRWDLWNSGMPAVFL